MVAMNQTRRAVPRRWLAMLCLAATLGCRRDPAAAAASFVASGDRYVASGQLEAATLDYRNALTYQPNSAAIRYKLALAYDRLKNHDEAIVELARVTELDGSNVDAALRVADAMLEARRFSDAERLSHQALAQEPRNVRGLTMLSRALDGRAKPQEAAASLDRALSIAPRDPAALVARAARETAARRFADARRSIEQALASDAQFADAWIALGTVEWADGRLDAAERAYRKVLELSDDKTPAHRLLAGFYVQTGRDALAEPHLRAIAENGGADRLALADFELQRGRVSEAETLLATLITDKPVAAQAHLRRAVVLRGRGENDHAIRELTLAIADPAVEAQGRLLLSELNAEKGDVEAALREAHRAAELSPKWADAHYRVGVLARAAGDLDDAERALKRARDLADTPDAVDLELAAVALAKGEPARAAQLADGVIARAPSAAGYLLLARASRAHGDLARARDAVARAERTGKDLPDIAVERGFVELADGHPAAAREAFARAMQLDPKSDLGRAGLVAAQTASGQGDVARRAVAEWRETAPANVQLAILAAKLDLADGHPDRAVRTLEDLLPRAESQPDVLQALAEVQLASGDRAAALRRYQELVDRRPRDTAAFVIIGMLEQDRGDKAAARRAYQRALALDPQSVIASNNLAWVLANDGQAQEAIDYARRAVARSPGVPQVMDTEGWMYHLAGRHDDAIRVLTAVRDRDPDNPTYRYHLGAALLSAERPTDARTELQRALQLSSSFADADATRRLLATAAGRQ
jgi:tetratricopeptide (TPR) repeat protein